MSEVYISSATRTAVASFNGSLANLPAHDLGKVVLQESLKRSNLDPSEVDEVILGQVLTAATGQNPARQASMNAGINKETPAWVDFTMGINMTRNPAGVIPAGILGSGMPVALQIIGGQREDLTVLKAMHAFESVLDFNHRASDHENK